MIVVRPGELEHFVRLERRIESTDFGSAGSETWQLIDEIWIGIRDSLPSRGERTEGGFTTSTRPARVRMYWRDDVETGMRLVEGNRIMQIVSGPAELGRRGGIELMVEDYNPGTAAA
ncbi:head-tail adaptor protein [Sphingomonas sp. CFBP 13603]|uniref:phage head completion protein n=1 Tax=Sphingomonas sp. CFBP 13603 TaxID=2774040 RepID=UPI001867FFFD|nr:head-tail adaptor protein [Sphingomonas sp. CFBP 13603]MBE2990889.1 head-tail adaptor protein [Sphingomonas sp. CFBP 13603]